MRTVKDLERMYNEWKQKKQNEKEELLELVQTESTELFNNPTNIELLNIVGIIPEDQNNWN